MVKALLTTLALFFGLSLSAVYAGEQSYPFTLAGKVDILKSGYKGIVIDDMSYRLSPNIVIHGEKDTIASRRDLKEGIKIGANLSSSSSPGKMIYELWILPGNFDISGFNNEDDNS